jgi:RNA-directed DNA polymerase
MKPSEENIQDIKALFSKMKTREDLLKLLNKAKAIYYGEKATLIELKSLTYYSNPKVAKKRYGEFTIRKKSGGVRKINAPVKGLKSIQTILNFILQCVFEPHQAATGFILGKSIVDNARLHAGRNYVFNIDMKDFFPSIEQARVWKRLQYPPFNLNRENENIEIASRIAALCCTEMEVERLTKKGEFVKVKRNVLPQGAPTSPTITNIIAQKLDQQLSGLAKRFNVNYSRYADDITFSSMHNVYQANSDFREELEKIITSQSFLINDKKTRLQKKGFRQETTGLIVNEKVNVHRRYVKQIRMWLYFWEKYGYRKAEQIFLRDYAKDKGHVKKGKPEMINVISGKLEFLKMVRGHQDDQYMKLEQRLNKLIAREQGIPPLEEILKVWESEGIEKAMEFSNLNQQ